MRTFLFTLLLATTSLPSVVERNTTPGRCVSGLRTINGRQCRLECGVDHVGGDYNKIHTKSRDACAQACASDGRCITSTYRSDNGFCYLKSSIRPSSRCGLTDSVTCSPIISGSCTKNQCFWQAKDWPKQCSSFMRPTVTPCPATFTTTSTETFVSSLFDRDITSELDKRTVAEEATCTASTQRPSRIPLVAPSCGGSAQYSSACGCAGYKPHATTLPQNTIIVTTTTTLWVTPTVATTVDLITITATPIVEDPTKTTSSTTTTSTEAAQQTCATFKFVNYGGGNIGSPFYGFFLTNYVDNLVNVRKMEFVYRDSDATLYTFRPDSKVYDSSNTYGWAVTLVDTFVFVLSDKDHDSPTFSSSNYLTCNIGLGLGSESPDVIGALSCQLNETPLRLGFCRESGSTLVQVPANLDPNAGCEEILIAVVPGPWVPC